MSVLWDSLRSLQQKGLFPLIKPKWDSIGHLTHLSWTPTESQSKEGTSFNIKASIRFFVLHYTTVIIAQLAFVCVCRQCCFYCICCHVPTYDPAEAGVGVMTSQFLRGGGEAFCALGQFNTEASTLPHRHLLAAEIHVKSLTETHIHAPVQKTCASQTCLRVSAGGVL